MIKRIIKVSKGSAECQEFTQYHYLNWPDFGVPYDPSPLVELVDLMRSQSIVNGSNNIVHCSAGVGRTGTFIGICWIMDMIDKGAENINVFKTVMEMRRQRTQMVRRSVVNLLSTKLFSIEWVLCLV